MDLSKIDLDEVMEAVQEDDGAGFCVECGARAEDFVEPDAERYECGECYQLGVYGAEQLLLMMVP